MRNTTLQTYVKNCPQYSDEYKMYIIEVQLVYEIENSLCTENIVFLFEFLPVVFARPILLRKVYSFQGLCFGGTVWWPVMLQLGLVSI